MSKFFESNVLEISEKSFQGQNLPESFTGYVLFFADWCGHCQKLKPIWSELSNIATYQVAAVDCTSDNQSLIEVFGIAGFPSVQCFKNGKYIGEYSGDRNIDAYQTYASHNFSSDSQPIVPVKKSNKIWLFILLILGLIGIIFYYRYYA